MLKNNAEIEQNQVCKM